MEKEIITSESVTEGHPDKICDYISDIILDEYLKYDDSSYVACETIVSGNLLVIFGEITSKVDIDIESLVRNAIKEIGYTDINEQFNYKDVEIIIKVRKQSSDIELGVKQDKGAGDQGIMFGYATNETNEFMPIGIVLAHRLTKRLEECRKIEGYNFLKPDGKAQVTVEYKNNRIYRIDNIIVSTQHTDNISIDKLREFVKKEIIEKVIPNNLLDNKTKYYINPTGRFVIGGPEADSGLTGRKIIVDSYGTNSRHGGGAFSGKDPSKVDRSAAYLARYIAKNIVATGLINKLEVGLSYSIGQSEPTSIMINSFGNIFDSGLINESDIVEMIKIIFPLSPQGIIRHFNLRQPIYKNTTNYGHFGKSYLPWEQLDKVKEIKEYFTQKKGVIFLK